MTSNRIRSSELISAKIKVNTMKFTNLIPLLGYLTCTVFALKDETTTKIVDTSIVTDFEVYTLPFIARDLEFLSILVDRIENEACRNQCKAIVTGLHNLTTWAVEFYDASGKLPEGVLR